MPTRLAAFLSLALVALGPGCPAGAEKKRLAPVEAREAKSTHGPYGAGACETCHERHDAANPGAAVKVTNDLCVGCHEEFTMGKPVRLDRSSHPVNDAPCVGCHNPHNARKPKLQL
jgi:predicted CXXCH cytochrome family protein